MSNSRSPVTSDPTSNEPQPQPPVHLGIGGMLMLITASAMFTLVLAIKLGQFGDGNPGTWESVGASVDLVIVGLFIAGVVKTYRRTRNAVALGILIYGVVVVGVGLLALVV